MKFKKLALRGAVILTVIVACCMFFAQTVLTITTPKVKIVQGQEGKLEDKISLEGEVYFAKTEKFTFDDAKTLPIIVTAVHVAVGSTVKAGDIIYTARLGKEYDTKLEELTKTLKTKQADVLKTEMDNVKVKETDTEKNIKYRAFMDATEAYMSAQFELISDAAQEGITLSKSTTKWAEELKAASSEVLTKYTALTVLETTMADAEDEFLTTYARSKGGKKETFEYINKLASQRADVEMALLDIVKLTASKDGLSTVRAPHDGTIVKLGVEAGKPYGGTEVAYEISEPDVKPMLRAKVTSIKKDITPGMRVDIKVDYMEVKASVADVTRDLADKYIMVEITDEIMSAIGGLNLAMGSPTSLKLVYRAKDTTSLLPPSAVRSEGEGSNFVYVIAYKNSFWGQEMIVNKVNVTVLERSDKAVSVAEEMYYTQLADKEDRTLSEGARVMEYVN